MFELEKEKAAIVFGKHDQLIPIIETVIAAANAGELDVLLSEMRLTRPILKVAK